MDRDIYRISVRQLVEFILRHGDLDNRTGKMPDAKAMMDGSRIHRKIQKSAGGDYRAEVTLKDEVIYDDAVISVEGRADGIFHEGSGEDEITVIDEIKGIEKDVDKLEEPRLLHLAQARVYAAIYAADENLEEIRIRMTYVNLDSEEIRYFYQDYEAKENQQWYKELVDAYHRWVAWDIAHRAELLDSMTELTFPFPYRQGQRHLVASVYQAIKDQQQLFVEAPTGVGKTMSVIYPSVRAIGEGKIRRIFYLTAKNVTRQVACEAFHILDENGLRLKYVTITAKEKICPMHETDCNPDYCPYARGHFDRINEAVFSLLNEKYCCDAAVILEKAKEAMVCPFELALDVSSWCDSVIGDYNYAFDPRAHLKRFFGDGVNSQGVLLIDEAHNLVERGREMYSASLSKKSVLAVKKAFKGKSVRVVRSLDRINRHLLKMRHLVEEEEKSYYRYTHTDGLDVEMMRLVGDMQHFFENDTTGTFQSVSEEYFAFRDFVDASDRMTDRYLLYAEIDDENDLVFHIRCIDPSEDLQAMADKAVSTVYFSATLLPMDYFRNLLSGREQDYAVYAETPFLPEQKCVLIGQGVGTRYKDRGNAMYRALADYIYETASAKKGHYMAFFPSYKMMQDVFSAYRRQYGDTDVNWVIQGKYMGDEDRAIFLENFYEDPEDTLIGFCVMGGLFAEGIDLTGSRLIGAIVVGCGLPQVSSEKELEMLYYRERHMDGFGYAYRIPGMNKVLQAAGRVIRSLTDKGVIVLLDDRFRTEEYLRLFPREWRDYQVVTLGCLPDVLDRFWGKR